MFLLIFFLVFVFLSSLFRSSHSIIKLKGGRDLKQKCRMCFLPCFSIFFLLECVHSPPLSCLVKVTCRFLSSKEKQSFRHSYGVSHTASGGKLS